MKTILHVVEYFNVAGAENIVSVLVERTKAENTQNKVIVLNRVGINGKRLQEKGIHVTGLLREKKQMGTIKMVLALCHHFQKQKMDIIHAHNYTSWFFCVLSNMLIRKKLLVTLHGRIDIQNSLIKKMIIRFLVKHTDRIVCVATEIQNDLLGITLSAKNKIVLIINGINLNKFKISVDRDQVRKELGLELNDYVLTTVGRFYEIKNFERQIELVANLSQKIPNIKLLIAARLIKYSEKIKILAKQLGVEDRVIFLGLRDDIPKILKASDLFVMSSFSEGTSLSLIEAMAARLPVVVSNVGGNPNLVQKDVNGYLFDLEKEWDFEEKVLSVYSDTSIAAHFSKTKGRLQKSLVKKE